MPAAKAGKRPLRSLTAHEKLEAIKRVHEGESKASVARDIGVPESTLRGWCKNEEKITYISRQTSSPSSAAALPNNGSPAAVASNTVITTSPADESNVTNKTDTPSPGGDVHESAITMPTKPPSPLRESTPPVITTTVIGAGLDAPDPEELDDDNDGPSAAKIPRLDEHHQHQAGIATPYNLSLKDAVTTPTKHSPQHEENITMIPVDFSVRSTTGVSPLPSISTPPLMTNAIKPVITPVTSVLNEREKNKAELARLSVELGLNKPEMFTASSDLATANNLNFLNQWNALILQQQQQQQVHKKSISQQQQVPDTTTQPYSDEKSKLPKLDPPKSVEESVWYWLKTQQAVLGLTQQQPSIVQSPVSASTTPTQAQQVLHMNGGGAVTTTTNVTNLQGAAAMNNLNVAGAANNFLLAAVAAQNGALNGGVGGVSSGGSNSLGQEQMAWFWKWYKQYAQQQLQVQLENGNRQHHQIQQQQHQQQQQQILYQHLIRDKDLSAATVAAVTAASYNNENKCLPQHHQPSQQTPTIPVTTTSTIPQPSQQTSALNNHQLLTNIQQHQSVIDALKLGISSHNNHMPLPTPINQLQSNNNNINNNNNHSIAGNKVRAVLDNLMLNNNNNNIAINNTLNGSRRDKEDELIAQQEALDHGEKFLKWLECCGEPSVTAMQIVQLRGLINNIKMAAGGHQKVKGRRK